MRSRHTARRLALDVLYESEIRGTLPSEAWAQSRVAEWGTSEGEVDGPAPDAPEDAVGYALSLVAGVQEHATEIDELIVRYTEGWSIERMPVVDRSLLRIAIFELGWNQDVPVAVVINEAVELAKEYSTLDSGRFLNGMLGKIAESLPR